MDKNKIKEQLTKKFVSEEVTPGISVTDKAKKESAKINKDGVKAIEKDVTSYDKSLKKENPDMSKMAKNKYNYTDDAEKTYHDEMEILNGQEMIEYTSEPGSEFKKRAEEAIEGSSRMGNAIGGNAEESWSASKDSFGKDLVKRVKDSSKKRAEAEIQTYGMGDVQIPTGNKVQVATTAVGATKPKGDTTKETQSASEKSKIKTVKENNNINNHSQIKEPMKRLKFNNEFKGVNTTQKLGHALTLIPEGYKVDNKEFEMTDGILSCRVRWEGNLNEGKAVVLQAADKTKINEDMSRMKTLMGYKSQDTLGLVKGNARLDENLVFSDIWKKTREMLGESEDIEDADAKEGDLDDAVNVAPEAKKHIEGSVSTDKGTKAPKAKEGNWEEISVPQASEAKKHVEGTASTDKGTQAPAPKEGNWEEIKKKSTDATKDVESGKSTNMATDKAKVVTENEDKEEEEEDTYDKPDSDDDSATDAEPSASDISAEVPPVDDASTDDDVVVPAIPTKSSDSASLLFSPSTGEYWIKKGDASTKVTDEYLSIAADKTKKGAEKATLILQKMQDDVDNSELGTGIEGLEEYGDEHPISREDALSGKEGVKEYGDEHPISTSDAVKNMKLGKK